MAKTCDCPKCNGTGNLPRHANVLGGVCFRCEGTGKVAYRVARQNRFSPINAMHCKTAVEAREYRLAEFAKRFPDVKLTEEQAAKVGVGGGNFRQIVGAK